MTMRDNVEVLKESIEKSKRIEELEDHLMCADCLIGRIIRTSYEIGILELIFQEPLDTPAP